MAQVEMLEKQIADFEARIGQIMAEHQEITDRLNGIPGVDERIARTVIAEIGTDRTRFPSADHLCSWAGVCPGNNESAGQRKSGRTRGGNRWLCRTLVQAAWAGSRTRHSYFQAQHRRIARRRGPKRATMAVARSILTVFYHMLKTGSIFKDLGASFFDCIKPDRAVKNLLNRLAALGYDAQLTPKAA